MQSVCVAVKKIMYNTKWISGLQKSILKMFVEKACRKNVCSFCERASTSAGQIRTVLR